MLHNNNNNAYYTVAQHDFVLSGSVRVWTLQGDGSTVPRDYAAGSHIFIPPYTPHVFDFYNGDCLLAEWWDGPFAAWYYEPYRTLVEQSFPKTTIATTTTTTKNNDAPVKLTPSSDANGGSISSNSKGQLQPNALGAFQPSVSAAASIDTTAAAACNDNSALFIGLQQRTSRMVSAAWQAVKEDRCAITVLGGIALGFSVGYMLGGMERQRRRRW